MYRSSHVLHGIRFVIEVKLSAVIASSFISLNFLVLIFPIDFRSLILGQRKTSPVELILILPKEQFVILGLSVSVFTNSHSLVLFGC